MVSCAASGERVEVLSASVTNVASVSTFLVEGLGFAMPIKGYNLSLSAVSRVRVEIFNMQNDEWETQSRWGWKGGAEIVCVQKSFNVRWLELDDY